MSPPLSVVIATTEGWAQVGPVVAAIRSDVERVGGEIVVADGSGLSRPTAEVLGSAVRWLESDKESVFELYAIGLRAARGDVVATTEDHAIPRDGWVDAILRAHSEHPEAAAIGGAIENGSRASLMDWASYFITQGPHMAPLGDRRVTRTTNEANVSYKRAALESLDDNDAMGFMAILHNRRLADRGDVLREDDRMVVDHFQQVGWRQTSTIHYHNGRSISGFLRQRGMSREDWIRLAAALVLPAFRTARAVRTGWRKRRLRRELVASAPLMLWLDYCQGFGHLIGYALGAGDSPRHLK